MVMHAHNILNHDQLTLTISPMTHVLYEGQSNDCVLNMYLQPTRMMNIHSLRQLPLSIKT